MNVPKLPTAKSELRLWYMEWQLDDAYSRSLLQKTSFVGLRKGQERLFYPYMHLYVLNLRIAQLELPHLPSYK